MKFPLRAVELEGFIVNEMCKVIPLNLMVLLSGFRHVSMSYVTPLFEILSSHELGMTQTVVEMTVFATVWRSA